jgi:hypothetical protein
MQRVTEYTDIQKSPPENFWLFVGTYFILGLGGILFAVFGGLIKQDRHKIKGAK